MGEQENQGKPKDHEQVFRKLRRFAWRARTPERAEQNPRRRNFLGGMKQTVLRKRRQAGTGPTLPLSPHHQKGTKKNEVPHITRHPQPGRVLPGPGAQRQLDPPGPPGTQRSPRAPRSFSPPQLSFPPAIPKRPPSPERNSKSIKRRQERLRVRGGRGGGEGQGRHPPSCTCECPEAQRAPRPQPRSSHAPAGARLAGGGG